MDVVWKNTEMESLGGESWNKYPNTNQSYNGSIFVSNMGRVKVMDKKIKHKPRKNKPAKTNRGGKSEYICKQHISVEGYCIVNLFGKSMKVHRMVCESFHGIPEINMVVNHIDCDKANNNITNLEWCTRKHNAIHAWNHNLIHKSGLINHKGENHEASKLTATRVHVIRKLNGKIFSDSELGKLYGVCREAIRDTRLYKRWNHV